MLAQTLRGCGWPPPDRAHPGVNGTILFEWFGPFGFLCVDVTGPRSAVHKLIRPGARVAEIIALPEW